MTEDEDCLLRLDPRLIFNDPKTASRRRTIELVTLQRKIEARFYEKKVSPGHPIEQFISELDMMLQNFYNNNSSQSLIIRFSKKTKNYNRLVKRLKHKLRLTNTILQKIDKSIVFHLGRAEDYERGYKEYMNKTKAYHYRALEDSLPNLITRTNKYLLDLRLAKWLTQKQHEQL